MDEHRIGLKPIHRRVWAPIGERPVALGHHRYEWLYVTAFVAPATGETVWYLSNGIDKPFFAELLKAFARTIPLFQFLNAQMIRHMRHGPPPAIHGAPA